MMRRREFLILPLLSLARQANAQGSITLSIGTRTRYNDQQTGANSWPNNGRHIDDDTGRATWSSDGTVYVVMNDGLGPNSSLSGGRNLFITSLSDGFTGPSSGQLYTMRNSMDSYGTITQLNTNGWTDGKSWKTEGLHCQDGVMYLCVYRQGGSNFDGGSIIKSTDNGLTWVNFTHTNHATGAPTITPLANGDAPTGGQQMFDFTGMRGIEFIQYGQDNVSASVVENNNTWTYGYLMGQTTPDIYPVRILRTDLPLLDATKYQFYRGSGSSTVDANWSTNQADKFTLAGVGSNLISNVMYIAASGHYILEAVDLNQDAVFFSSRSVCGPYTEIGRIAFGGDLSQTQAWFSPVIKTMSTVIVGANYVTTMLWINGWAVNGRTGSPSTNLYSQHNHFLTFTSPIIAATRISGKATIGGKVSIQ